MKFGHDGTLELCHSTTVPGHSIMFNTFYELKSYSSLTQPKLIQCLIASSPEMHGSSFIDSLHCLYRPGENSEEGINMFRPYLPTAFLAFGRIYRRWWEERSPGLHRPASYATIFPSCKEEFLAWVKCYSLRRIR